MGRHEQHRISADDELPHKAEGPGWTVVTVPTVQLHRGPRVSLGLFLTHYGYPEVSMSKPGNRPEARQLVQRFAAALPADQEFGWSQTFDAVLVDEFVCGAVFPMALFPDTSDFPGCCVFAPKLHTRRMVLSMDGWRPGRSARKRARAFEVSMTRPGDPAYQEVLRLIVQQHGENWMCRPLAKVFAYMHDHPEAFRTRMYGICIWAGDRLAAVEAGYSVGEVYTSLTGATVEPHAGSVQLATLGRLLQQCGFKYWDLGMDMEYKKDLGAKDLPRGEWRGLVGSSIARTADSQPVLRTERRPCAEVCAPAAGADDAEGPSAEEAEQRAAAAAARKQQQQQKQREAGYSGGARKERKAAKQGGPPGSKRRPGGAGESPAVSPTAVPAEG